MPKGTEQALPDKQVDAFDLVRLEAQARSMAVVFGIDPDEPYPERLRRELRKANAFHPDTWKLPVSTPAWRVLARELIWTQHLNADEPSE